MNSYALEKTPFAQICQSIFFNILHIVDRFMLQNRNHLQVKNNSEIQHARSLKQNELS